MSKLEPDDIFETYGSFNDLTVGDKTPIANRRTLTTTEALSKALEGWLTPDVLKGKSVYDGVVMASIASNSPTLQSNQALIEFLSDPPEKILHYIYKVYIPEVEPRCINFSSRGTPSGGFTNAQRVMTLPNAIMDASVPASENMRAIEAGTYVQVIFANQEKLKNPKIIAIGKKIIELKGKLNDPAGGPLQTTFSRNRGSSYAGSTAYTPGTPKPLTEAQKNTMAYAESTKDGLRRQIFEENDYGLKPKHNHTGKRSNAILAYADQTTLKRKHQTKINEVAAELGMDVKTLEKIFKKESGTFDPYAINHSTNATGLIQFMPKTASALGTSTDELLTMGPAKQLEYVEKYFKANKRSGMREEVDWYFIVFYPSAIGKEDSYVIGNARTAEVNPGYADPQHPEGLITRRRVKERWMA
tara:strand:- start:1084 stop:2328 length:1245 start_codon:yes stop_codon:yes gene_type:complete